MRNYPVQILSVANTGSHTGSSYFVGQAAAASFTPVCGDTAAVTVKIQISSTSGTGSIANELGISTVPVVQWKIIRLV